MTDLWPHCPDAPIVVPVHPRKVKPPKGVDRDRLGAAWVIGMDMLVFTATVDGIPVERPHRSNDYSVFGVPLAGVQHVEAGALSGAGDGVEHKVAKRGWYEFPELWPSAPWPNYLAERYAVGDGPAVWLRDAGDILLPHPDPQRLAAELERRRWRVARDSGFWAEWLWQAYPALRRQNGNHYSPGVLEQPPQRPELPRGAAWQSGGAPRPGSLAPAMPPQQPVPVGGSPYPEETADYALPLAGGATLTVTLRRAVLANASMAGPTAVVEEPERAEPPDHLDLPLAALPVIQAGTVRGLSEPYEIRRVTPDTRTVVSTSVRNGPALWLWGQLGEWLLCHDEAERIAADLRLRRRIGCRFPISSIFGPERKAWREYFDTLPLDQQDGRAAPAPPSYAPAAPTLLPPERWSPNPAATS